MPPEDRDLYLINSIIDDDKIDEITYNNDSILISIDLNMVFTAQHAKYSIFDDSKKIFETLLDEYYSEVYIIWSAPGADEYGHDEMFKVMEIAMDKDTGKMINWSGVSNENLPELAKKYWQHPDFD